MEEPDPCFICFHEILEDDFVFKHTDKHVFHFNCVWPWLLFSGNYECPLCRVPIPDVQLPNGQENSSVRLPPLVDNDVADRRPPQLPPLMLGGNLNILGNNIFGENRPEFMEPVQIFPPPEALQILEQILFSMNEMDRMD